LHNLKDTLVSLKRENGRTLPEPVLSEVEKELGHKSTIFSEQEEKL